MYDHHVGSPDLVCVPLISSESPRRRPTCAGYASSSASRLPFIRVVRGLKELTIYDNIANLVRITNRLDDLIGPDYEIENLDTADFIMIRNSSTSSERTCKREIEILRRFIRYLTGHDPQRFRIMWNNTDDFAPNRKFITEEQWEKLIEGTGPRECLILILGAAMGLRRAEIAKIKLTDINGNILTVHGKGHGDQGKVVQMEMTKPVVDAILEWMPLRMDFLRRFGDNSDGYLLINQWRGKGTPMTPGGVGDVVRKLGRERGIDLTAHSLRRLFANMVNESCVDSDTLRRLMRHVSVQTTFSCYLNVNPKKMEMASEYVADKLLKITMKELPQPSF
ncbi:MAG: hypothetical protein A3205_04010 [Methanomassiliicoccales archaeon Mx-03]|nr:MAG: hypothetical protein A3205_04010 [Methanomassiliicoccales archaeon Mx-03]